MDLPQTNDGDGNSLQRHRVKEGRTGEKSEVRQEINYGDDRMLCYIGTWTRKSGCLCTEREAVGMNGKANLIIIKRLHFIGSVRNILIRNGCSLLLSWAGCLGPHFHIFKGVWSVLGSQKKPEPVPEVTEVLFIIKKRTMDCFQRDMYSESTGR